MPFPMFKIKALTLETPYAEDGYVIPPAIEELLRHSPDLKKLTLHTKTRNTNPVYIYTYHNQSSFIST